MSRRRSNFIWARWMMWSHSMTGLRSIFDTLLNYLRLCSPTKDQFLGWQQVYKVITTMYLPQRAQDTVEAPSLGHWSFYPWLGSLSLPWIAFCNNLYSSRVTEWSLTSSSMFFWTTEKVWRLYFSGFKKILKDGSLIDMASKKQLVLTCIVSMWLINKSTCYK